MMQLVLGSGSVASDKWLEKHDEVMAGGGRIEFRPCFCATVTVSHSARLSWNLRMVQYKKRQSFYPSHTLTLRSLELIMLY